MMAFWPMREAVTPGEEDRGTTVVGGLIMERSDDTAVTIFLVGGQSTDDERNHCRCPPDPHPRPPRPGGPRSRAGRGQGPTAGRHHRSRIRRVARGARTA